MRCLFVGLVLAFGLSACAASNQASKNGQGAPDAATRTAADYAPYAIGQSRSYRMNMMGQISEKTVTVQKMEAGYFVDDLGGRFQHTRNGLRDAQRYLIPTPLEIGAKWTSVVSANAVERFEVVSLGEPCEVPAGRFPDCVVVLAEIRRDADVSMQTRFTWARGLGLVRVQVEAKVKDKPIEQSDMTLIRFTEPKPKV